MDRTFQRHMDEELNLRSFYLRLIKKIWIIPLAALVGALLCGGIYTLVNVTFGPARSYSTESKLYIKFAYDEQAGTLVDYYNAFTWNSLMSTDDILPIAMENLQKAGVSKEQISEQEIIDSVKAEIPSDVRLLLVTLTNNSQKDTDLITDAIDEALVNYGNTNEAFDSIKLIGKTDSALVTYTDRTFVAVIFGAVLFAVAAILVLLLVDALDDAVYVPEDCEKRYKLPVLGVLFEKDSKDAFFKNELQAAYEKYIAGAERVVLIASDSVKDAENSKKDLDSLKKALGSGFDSQLDKVTAMEIPGNVLDNYRKIGASDGVVLTVPAGKRCGSMSEHIIAQLKKHECPVLGIILVRADAGFLRRYYRIK